MNETGRSTLAERIHARYPRKENGRIYLGTGSALVLIALIILVLACFAALTYWSAESKMEVSQSAKVACDNYYAAETAASELLSGIATGEAKPSDTSGVKAVYDTSAGKVTVTKSGAYTAFSVAIDANQALNVEAEIKDQRVLITTWAVEPVL